MTRYDIAHAMADLIAQEADRLNVPDLVNAGFPVRTDQNEAQDVSDLYQWIKVDWRPVVGDGLTICVVPTGDEDDRHMSGWQTVKKAKISIVCYFDGAGAEDPRLLLRARRALEEGLIRLFNAPSRQGRLDTAAGHATKCRILRAENGPTPTLMGRLVQGLLLEWEGLYIETESEYE